MNLATKTLATIMLIAMLTLSSANVSAATRPSQPHTQKQREARQLERLYRHHDRKMELRASVLGISPDELRERAKSQPFEQIIKKAGFKDQSAFHLALIGKMKNELRKRGWDDQKVQDFVKKRMNRYQKATANA